MAELLRLHVPGSKSETQRALILAALAGGESEIARGLDCSDSQELRACLARLGVSIEAAEDVWRVQGGKLRAPQEVLHCGEGGTTLRFLAPLSLVLEGELRLDGSRRLRERPVADLLMALEHLRVEVRYLETEGRLPVALQRQASSPDRVVVSASESSQFASGLLLIAPCLPGGLTVELSGQPVSRPYLALTVQLMRRFGAAVVGDGQRFVVGAGGYRPCRVEIEGDWSGAAFLLAAAWISGREVCLDNLRADSPQGDRAILDHLLELSQPRPHSLDLSDAPDLIAPLAASAAFASHPVELRGVAHARLKESDRPEVLAGALTSVGARACYRDGTLVIEPQRPTRSARLDPRGDHRMAMAFGLLSLGQRGIEVLGRECVRKSYPGFWHDLEQFR